MATKGHQLTHTMLTCNKYDCVVQRILHSHVKCAHSEESSDIQSLIFLTKLSYQIYFYLLTTLLCIYTVEGFLSLRMERAYIFLPRVVLDIPVLLLSQLKF